MNVILHGGMHNGESAVVTNIHPNSVTARLADGEFRNRNFDQLSLPTGTATPVRHSRAVRQIGELIEALNYRDMKALPALFATQADAVLAAAAAMVA